MTDSEAKAEIEREIASGRIALEAVRTLASRERAKSAVLLESLRRVDAELFHRICELRSLSKQLGNRIDASYWERWKRGEVL